jgi:putative ABC transport system permease protein
MYDLRLALLGLWRSPGLSLAVFACMALATSSWSATVFVNLRFYGPGPALPASLHQVELPHSHVDARATSDTNAKASDLHTRTRVSLPEYQALAASGITTRQTGTFRSPVLVAPAGGAAPLVAKARFVGAAFFDMFALRLRAGRGFSRDEESAVAPVVVLGRKFSQRVLGAGVADAVSEIVIEGRRFRVVGVIADDQPFHPTWDITTTGAPQDDLYLPWPWWQPLLARPEFLAEQSVVGPGFDDLVRSDAIFVSHWIDLPREADRQAYAGYLTRTFAARGITPVLRDVATWQRTFSIPQSDVSLYMVLVGILLVGGGLNVARLLLARGIAVRGELGIRRALGATRSSLFLRTVLEGALLALPAVLAGLLLAAPYLALYNRLVDRSGIPVQVTGLGILLGVVPPFAVGILAALYPAWRSSQTPPITGGRPI